MGMTVKKEIDVMDRETVMLWLDICGNDDCYDICPYRSRRPDCMYMLMANALSLLKEREEIRHGEWKWSHGGECSECGYHNSNFNYKYCPMCGAMMDA